MHTLLLLEPGHFHAALTLRETHPLLSDDVFVYAKRGTEWEKFQRIVESYNSRSEMPARWRVHLRADGDPLDQLVSERRGDVVIVAGQNHTKMAAIHRLHREGFHVLGDKPWVISAATLGPLREAAAGPPLAMDIMTERHEIAARLQKALMAEPEVFGDLLSAGGNAPAITMESVHHLYKLVNNAPLERPSWYFDVNIQGQGILDVPVHLVDLAQWMTGDAGPFDYDRDVELISAERWATGVPRSVFTRITGLDDFPGELAHLARDGVLPYLCNGAFTFRLRGVLVQIRSVWALEIPPGGGDTHRASARGTLADLVIQQDGSTGFRTRLQIRPHEATKSWEQALDGAMERLQAEATGVAASRSESGWDVVIPDALRTTHEEHFSMVLDQFLRYVDAGQWPDRLGPDLVTKYTLLAKVGEMAASQG